MDELEQYQYNKGEQDGSMGYGYYDPPGSWTGWSVEETTAYNEAYDKGWSYARGQYDYNNDCRYNPTGDEETYDEGWENAKEQDDN